MGSLCGYSGATRGCLNRDGHGSARPMSPAAAREMNRGLGRPIGAAQFRSCPGLGKCHGDEGDRIPFGPSAGIWFHAAIAPARLPRARISASVPTERSKLTRHQSCRRKYFRKCWCSFCLPRRIVPPQPAAFCTDNKRLAAAILENSCWHLDWTGDACIKHF